MSNTKRDQYINTIASNGHKISRDEVVHVWPVHPHGTSELPSQPNKTRPRHMWVEKGNEKSGFSHVTQKHGAEYADNGVPPDKQEERLPQFMEASTTVGRFIGWASKSAAKKQDRPVMSTYFKDEKRVVQNGITVADNGYVVGMGPVGDKKIKRKPGDPREVSHKHPTAKW
ncbi:hypothetical protein PG991_010679 [Apiospora marii]|uniref:Uncharacterized protein n=1 Tax=Apiospora marii TaxID=335849 RepID=A0ABR1RC22_9PEZI